MESKKILLINPAHIIKGKNMWKNIDRAIHPIGLAYLASVLLKDGHNVKIIDLGIETMGIKGLKDHIAKFNPDIIGITATTALVKSAVFIIKEAKKAAPKSKIVMGGVHPSLLPEEVLKNKDVDYVLRGEGERAFPEFAKGTNPEKIKGFYFRKGKKIVDNGIADPIYNLDALPFPAYKLLKMEKYRPSLGNYRRLPAVAIITSRGCPGKCTFCNTEVFGKRTRFRSAENIIAEIEMLIRDYKIKEISFYDDTFTANRPNVQRFCKLIIEKGIDLTWSCMSRVDCVDFKTLKLMKKAGCHQIGYGIESADAGILKNINKMVSLEQAEKAIAMTKKVGIDARAMFMFGNPGETIETMKKTLRYSIKIDPDLVVYNITTPFPGTAMFNWAKENNYLNTYDWDDYDLARVVMELPSVSPKEIVRFYRKAYKKFYLRPRYLIKRIMKIRSFNDLKMNFTTFLSLIGFD